MVVEKPKSDGLPGSHSIFCSGSIFMADRPGAGKIHGTDSGNCYVNATSYSPFFKLGYVLKNPSVYSVYNVLLWAVIVFLYDKLAKYEEGIMSRDKSYVYYLDQVKYRFVPGIY